MPCDDRYEDCYDSPSIWDTAPVEYFTESDAYADDDEGWDNEDEDEEEEEG